jgi:hypothetical protein
MKAYTSLQQVHATLVELGSCHGTTTLPTLHHYLATITPLCLPINLSLFLQQSSKPLLKILLQIFTQQMEVLTSP